MLDWCILTLASARLKASMRFPPLREMYQRGGTCKGFDNPGVMPETCGAIGERAQVILVWVRALGRWERLPPMETRSHEG